MRAAGDVRGGCGREGLGQGWVDSEKPG